MRHFLCLWLPNWPVQRRLMFSRDAESSERSALPSKTRVAANHLVLHAPVAGQPRVTACSREARQLGVKVGMLLAEAEALCAAAPTLFEPHDFAADRAALRQLAVRCQRFTPLAAVEPGETPDSLLLDVTGCGYGFGGLEGLAQAAVVELQEKTFFTTETQRAQRRKNHDLDSLCDLRASVVNSFSFFAVAALADTVGAAWAVAHYGDGERVRIVPPGGQEAALRPLPVEALRLPAATVAALHEFDIRRIEQLLALPRHELPCRFGPELLQRLDQALGASPELIEPEPQTDPIQASWPFEPPIADGRLLDAALGDLLEQVLQRLRPRQLGVRQMLCSLTLATGEPVRIPVGLVRPSDSWAHLIELLRLHLERVRVRAEMTEVSLFVASAVPLEFRQDAMFDESPGLCSLAPLIERLTSRLGEETVLQPRLEPDPQPEHAWQKKTVHHRDTENTERKTKQVLSSLCSPCLFGEKSVFRPPSLQHRPVLVRVMSVVPGGPPLSFEWKGRSFRIAHAWGPERIETGWWRGDDVRRDYYQVETATGERYWLFRRLPDERWFLHGVFT